MCPYSEEIARYKSSPARKAFWDPLQYWAQVKDEFPRLYIAAKVVLGVPASAVRSE